FVVHGLWPQHARGWPEFCDTRERWVPDERIRDMLPIMPSKRLIIHEWRKHGTCSGLSQDEYFGLTQRLFEKVRIPARYLSPTALVSVSPGQLADDFVKSNAWLDHGMIAVDCGNRRDRARLQEIKICFSPDGEPTRCGANERQQCRASTIQMPPVR
ncbi:MAG: ribonuclease T, partial [Parvibaculaceae bacterium]